MKNETNTTSRTVLTPKTFAYKEVGMEAILTVPEVALYLKMSKSKLYYLIQRREIPHFKIGRNVRIKESDLMKWLEKHNEPTRQ